MSTLHNEIREQFSSPSGSGKITRDLWFPVDPEAGQEELRRLGYFFNERGMLRQVENESLGFVFSGQKHYDALGDAVARFVFFAMQRYLKLRKLHLPCESSVSEDESDDSGVFVSDDLTEEKPVLVLVHGSGAVRAGQWARSVIINDCLWSGSALAYIHLAQQRNWSVLVANPNSAKYESPQQHLLAVYDYLTDRDPNSDPDHDQQNKAVSAGTPKTLLMVAHSFGGVCALSLLSQRPSSLTCLRALALTDSVHGAVSDVSTDVKEFLADRARNWTASKLPLDEPTPSIGHCDCVSAGHAKHVYTTASATDSVFAFLDAGLRTSE